MEVREFFKRLQEHCSYEAKMRKIPCMKCKYRDFCYTTPTRLTDELLTETLEKMENNL